MSDEAALMQEVAKADQAKALLQSPVLQAAFDRLEAEYQAAWIATGVNDHVTREKLYLAMKTLPAVRRNLEMMVNDGAVSRKQLANLDEDRQRAQKRR